jgi:hypothetical protein
MRKATWAQIQSAEETVTATKEALRDLPANIYQQCLLQLYESWQTCIAANGHYSKGGCDYV